MRSCTAYLQKNRSEFQEVRQPSGWWAIREITVRCSVFSERVPKCRPTATVSNLAFQKLDQIVVLLFAQAEQLPCASSNSSLAVRRLRKKKTKVTKRSSFRGSTTWMQNRPAESVHDVTANMHKPDEGASIFMTYHISAKTAPPLDLPQTSLLAPLSVLSTTSYPDAPLSLQYPATLTTSDPMSFDRLFHIETKAKQNL